MEVTRRDGGAACGRAAPSPVSAPVLPEAAAVVFQAASLLLDYPAGGEADVALVAAAIQELPSGEVRERLIRFLEWWERLTPRDREVAYVDTFDLGAKTSLYLTSRQSRDKHHRVQELLRLREAYRQFGWEACSGELPDYLPLVLEFAATVSEGVDLLGGEQEALARLRSSLEDSGSPFAEVVAAVLVVARDQTHDLGKPR